MINADAQAIQRWARLHQYHLEPLALKRFSDFLSTLSEEDATLQSVMRRIFNNLKRITKRDRSINADCVTNAINAYLEEIKGSNQNETAPSVCVVPLSEVPKVSVNDASGEFKLQQDNEAKGRLNALRTRYLLARRRCLRSGIYRRNLESGSKDVVPLLTSSALDGLPGDTIVAVLGLLVSREELYYLEDLSGSVRLQIDKRDLTWLTARRGFLSEGFTVVVTGTWASGCLRVVRMDLPPAELRGSAGKDLNAIDTFGLAPTNMEAAESCERGALQNVIIFLAHIHLDKSVVHDRLSAFFRTMEERSEEELQQTTFVLIGSFCSTSVQFGDVSHLPDSVELEVTGFQALLDKLGMCISSCSPTAAQYSHFILIPGPNDIASLQGVFPHPSIPSLFASGLQKKIKHLTTAPNPSRIRFLTQEIVVCRRDFLRCFQEQERKTWRECDSWAFNASTAIQPYERVVKTVIDEAHLCPELLEGGVLWKLDSALSLPTLPDLLLLCDTTEQWECDYKNVRAINPGSFTVSGTFLWYTPADRECTVSRLNA